jgi:hypothetical protein
MATDTKSYLPPEILTCIISYVHSKSSLCNIALCSSMFYSLTIPVLYAHVALHSRCHHFEGLRSLTVLFLTKSILAQYVRQFTLRDPIDNFQPNGHQNRPLDVRGVLREAIFSNSHSAEEFDEWTMHVASDHPDALLAILLPTMVKLEKLDLMLRNSPLYFDRMIVRAVAKQKPFDKQPLFPALKHFMHIPSWEPGSIFTKRSCDYQPMDSRYSTIFQSFPNICSIFGFNVSEVFEHRIRTDGMRTFVNDYSSLSGMSSSLTHLELTRSFITQCNLCIMLKIPKALITFIYEIIPTSMWLALSPISFEDILSALSPQYNSLDNLWLDGYEEMGPEPTHPSNNMSSSLSKFTCLRNLRVAAVVLLTILRHKAPQPRNFSGVFPATLETLHIIYDETEGVMFWDIFSGFVLAEMNQVPGLRKIFIQCNSDEEAPLDWKDLQEHAKSQGVDLISLHNFSSGAWCERGWGMDGSIKWAPCLGKTNYRRMPSIRDWKEDWEEKLITTSTGEYEEVPRDYFYKWHLCHEWMYQWEPYEDTTDHHTTTDEETDEESSDGEVDEADSDDDESDETGLDGH